MTLPSYSREARHGLAGYNAPLDATAFTILFSQLHEHPKREKIALACSKLAASRRKSDLIDTVIDLGTCLEIILMDDESGEIKYKVASRAAWLLGSDFDNRKEIFDLARDLYDSRSKAVHSGKLMLSRIKDKAERPPFFPNGSYDLLCCDLIKKILAKPLWPDWNSLILGG